MKKLFTFFCFLLLSGSVFAQYQTPGTGVRWTLTNLVANSSGSVTLTAGEYFINDSITIAQNDTLEILTNETIKLGTKIMVTIAGTLIIDPADSVKITAINPANRFHSLRFEEFSDASVLRKTIVEYGSGIRILGSDLLIDSCIIRYHDRTYNSGAITISNSSPVIRNSKIHHNFRSAFNSAANGNASPQIINNDIYFNGTENTGSWPQINLGPTTNPAGILIKDNRITGNRTNTTSGGISVANLLGSPQITNIEIDNNEVTDNRFGIALTGGRMSAYVHRNQVHNNNTNPNANTGGSGLNFNGDTTQVSVVAGNTVTGNLWGVTIQNRARPSFGKTGGSATNTGENNIHSNGNGGMVYDLYNNTPDSIYAQNNYWGSATTLQQVEDQVFHKNDDPSLGFVNFQPFLVVLGKPALLSVAPVSVYPNPAQNEVNFSFAATQPKDINVIIYDALGREAARLDAAAFSFSGEKAIGAYKTDALPNGLYIYRIVSGYGVSTGKFIIRK